MFTGTVGTVVKAVASEVPPMYVRRPTSTSFVVFEGLVRALLADESEMPATVIAGSGGTLRAPGHLRLLGGPGNDRAAGRRER